MDAEIIMCVILIVLFGYAGLQLALVLVLWKIEDLLVRIMQRM